MFGENKARGIVKAIICAVICAAVSLMLSLTAVGAIGTLIISDFADEVTVWSRGENVTRVDMRDFVLEQDGKEYTRSCLEVISSTVPVNTLRATVAKFDSALDLSGYRVFSFDIYTPEVKGDANAIYLIRLTLKSADGDSMEHLQMIEGGVWNHIEANMGSWDKRSAVVEAEIALAVDTFVNVYPADSFFVDDVSVSEPIDNMMVKRYLFDEYTAVGGTAALAEDMSKITLTPKAEEEMSLAADVVSYDVKYGANCLRIKLANYTDSDTMTLDYYTSDSKANTENKSVTLQITPNSDAQDYYVYVGDVTQLKNINLIFGDAQGSIEIISISAISSYEPYEYDTCGKLTACRVSDDLSSVIFTGEVEREAALANQGGYIAVYEYEKETLPTAGELLNTTPLARCTMTTRFELSYKLTGGGVDDASSRFIAVSVSEDGSYQLIAPPFYAEDIEHFAKHSYTLEPDIKGFSADDVSLVGDAVTGVTLLELDLSNAFVAKAKAQPYTYRGENYYINSEYADEIGAKINALTHDGTKVLLRVFGWSEELESSLDALYDADSSVNYSASSTPVGDDYFGAISSYIASRWGANGKISGVVYGDGENVFKDGQTLNSSVSRTARNLRTLYSSLISVNRSAKLYVSLTGLYSTTMQTNEAELGLLEYLPALIKHTNEHGQFPWEIAIEQVYRIGNTSESRYLTVNDCDPLREILASHGEGDKHIIFLDRSYTAAGMPKGKMVQSYVVGNYSAYFSDDIDAYIAITGSNGRFIADSVRSMGTHEEEAIVRLAELMLNVDDIAEVIEDYDKSKLPSYTITQAEAGIERPSQVKGKFTYFRFTSTANIGGISPSYYSAEMKIANDGGSVLAASLDAGRWGAEGAPQWMGIAHTFTIPEDFTITPIIALTLKVDGVTSPLSTVPVKLVLLSGNERFEALADVALNGWVTLYIDTESFGAAKNTTGFQILIGNGEVDAATLKVRSIEGLSHSHDDESLEKLVTESRLEKLSPAEESKWITYLPIIVIAAVVMATVAALAILGRKRGAKDE